MIRERGKGVARGAWSLGNSKRGAGPKGDKSNPAGGKKKGVKHE